MKLFQMHTGLMANMSLNQIVYLILSYKLNNYSFKMYYIICQSGSIQEIETTVGIQIRENLTYVSGN